MLHRQQRLEKKVEWMQVYTSDDVCHYTWYGQSKLTGKDKHDKKTLQITQGMPSLLVLHPC